MSLFFSLQGKLSPACFLIKAVPFWHSSRPQQEQAPTLHWQTGEVCFNGGSNYGSLGQPYDARTDDALCTWTVVDFADLRRIVLKLGTLFRFANS